MSIPKIIHQIWIGPKPKPSKFMDTWKNKNPDYEYICWSEEEIIKRQFVFRCQPLIDMLPLYHGKADIMRLEILKQFGGIYLDADSICIEPLGDFFLSNTAFAGYENENNREGLVANGNMGFVPNHPLCSDAIEWILDKKNIEFIFNNPPWISTGPGLITNLLNTGKYKDFKIYPSFTFLPLHFTGDKYEGHKKVFAYQEWGSTKQNYEQMNEIDLPEDFKTPSEWVSVLISSFNTKYIYIKECLESIKSQNGYFGIEVVWINDGSNALNTSLLERELKNFEINTRFTSVKYIKMEENKGISYCLREGVNLCSHEIIIKMDSDDIMMNNRIIKQLEFMKNNNDCVMCGSNIQFFKNSGNYKEKTLLQNTTHTHKITWDDYKKSKSHWIMNHPSLCYKKSAVLSVGNYNIKMGSMSEDLELELRMSKETWGCLVNIQVNHCYIIDYTIEQVRLIMEMAPKVETTWQKIRLKLIDELDKRINY